MRGPAIYKGGKLSKYERQTNPFAEPQGWFISCRAGHLVNLLKGGLRASIEPARR